jgi:hypothetical protein
MYKRKNESSIQKIIIFEVSEMKREGIWHEKLAEMD